MLLLLRGSIHLSRHRFRFRSVSCHGIAEFAPEHSRPGRLFTLPGFFVFDMAELLPLFLNLTGRRVLLVGGGPVAASKLETLLLSGADVLVVALAIGPEMLEAAASQGAPGAGSVTIEARSFDESDLAGVWLVVAAATPDVNRAVADAAQRRRLFVNAVDDPANASAYLGGVVRRDGITLAISSRGDAPGLTGLLREALDAVLPRDLRLWMDEARRQRIQWRRDGVPMAERRPLLLQALNVLYARRSRAAAQVDAVAQQPSSVEAPCP